MARRRPGEAMPSAAPGPADAGRPPAGGRAALAILMPTIRANFFRIASGGLFHVEHEGFAPNRELVYWGLPSCKG